MADEPPFYSADGITIYCGDCREIDAWDIAGGVMVTDPPYGMSHRSGMAGRFGDCRVDGDDDTEVRDYVLGRWAPRPALVFGRWSVPRPARTRQVLTWDKGDALGMGDLSIPWKPTTEEVYVIGSGFVGRRDRGSVLRYTGIGPYQQARGERFHPTQKPTDLMGHLIDRCPPLATHRRPVHGVRLDLGGCRSHGPSCDRCGDRRAVLRDRCAPSGATVAVRGDDRCLSTKQDRRPISRTHYDLARDRIGMFLEVPA